MIIWIYLIGVFLMKRNRKIILVTFILFALFSVVAFGNGSYELFLLKANAQETGGGPGMGAGRADQSSLEENEEIAVEVAEVKKDDFYLYLTESAQSEAYEEVLLTPRVQEVVTEVLVSVGDSVERGETLIKMDSRSSEISVIQAEASLKSTKANLQQALNGPRKEELARLQAQVTQAESELKLRKENYERQKQLFEEGYLSQEEIDQANNQLIAAQSGYQSALKNLEITEAGATEEEIDQLEAQVTQAEAQLESARLRMSYTEIAAPSGNLASIREIKSRISFLASVRFVPNSNSNITIELPSLLVELRLFRPSTVATVDSTGLVTSSSTSSGVAPL